MRAWVGGSVPERAHKPRCVPPPRPHPPPHARAVPAIPDYDLHYGTGFLPALTTQPQLQPGPLPNANACGQACYDLDPAVMAFTWLVTYWNGTDCTCFTNVGTIGTVQQVAGPISQYQLVSGRVRGARAGACLLRTRPRTREPLCSRPQHTRARTRAECASGKYWSGWTQGCVK